MAWETPQRLVQRACLVDLQDPQGTLSGIVDEVRQLPLKPSPAHDRTRQRNRPHVGVAHDAMGPLLDVDIRRDGATRSVVNG